MPFVSGFLRVRRGHPDNTLPGEEGPVDPDYGVGEGHPDQGLPGGGGGGLGIWGGGNRPDNGLPPLGSGAGPDNGLPRPPPGVFPPLTPSHPIQPAPGVPPGAIWPPVSGPVDPGYGRPEGGRPDQGLPGSGGRPDQGLPGSGGRPDHGLPSTKFWVVAGIPGVGWRYVCIDPSAVVPSHPIALPPPAVAQPKS